jgi:UDP-3-O-[3-hydroxymyristoyl] glucosamine N-acyltransferase
LPAEEAAKWRKSAARFRQLDALADRLSKLERKIAETTETNLKSADD